MAVDGDAEEFRRIDDRYSASPEREAAFQGVPNRVESMVLTLVQPIA